MLPHTQARVLAAITDGSRPFEDLLGRGTLARLEPSQADLLLALRGLLAGEFSLLAHALQKRHLVDFGINRCLPGDSLGRARCGNAPLSPWGLPTRYGPPSQAALGAQAARGAFPRCPDALGAVRVCSAGRGSVADRDLLL